MLGDRALRTRAAHAAAGGVRVARPALHQRQHPARLGAQVPHHGGGGRAAVAGRADGARPPLLVITTTVGAPAPRWGTHTPTTIRQPRVAIGEVAPAVGTALPGRAGTRQPVARPPVALVVASEVPMSCRVGQGLGTAKVVRVQVGPRVFRVLQMAIAEAAPDGVIGGATPLLGVLGAARAAPTAAKPWPPPRPRRAVGQGPVRTTRTAIPVGPETGVSVQVGKLVVAGPAPTRRRPPRRVPALGVAAAPRPRVVARQRT